MTDFRPDGITLDDLARWDRSAREYFAIHPLPPLHTLDRAIEHYRAADWLAEELHRRGAGDAEVTRQCFAMGQIHAAWKMVGIDRPWAASRNIVAMWAAGSPCQPGRELAAALLKETTGRETDPSQWPDPEGDGPT